MKLRDLSYLIALAKTEHFGKAAELVHVSQPTLSVQLKKLEDRLGVILVERDNKHVRLTPAGRIIAEKASLVFREIEGIKAYAASQKDPLAGDLQLGIIPTLAPYLLPKIIPKLHQAFPKLALWLAEEQTKQLLERLKNGELDLGILAGPIEDESFAVIPLFEEPFLLAVHPQAKLASKKSITLDDLKDEKILLLTEGHCLKDQVLGLCSRVDIQPVDFRSTSLETLRQMVAENLGSTLLPAMACEKPQDSVVMIPFKKPMPTRQICLVYRKTHVRDELFKALAKLVSKIYRSD